MKTLTVQNHIPFELNDIPLVDAERFYGECRNLFLSGHRLINLFAADKKIFAVCADNQNAQLQLLSTSFPDKKFRSFAGEFPHTNYLECELAENSGIIPEGHPWLRPVRNQDNMPDGSRYEFYKMHGEEVHEVAVGPIHAGVIEPGHFRFQCNGEKVYHLEISLGYQRRGIEKLMLSAGAGKRLMLAESIAGDTVIGHCSAYCLAMEALSKTAVSLRASVIRSIAEELERIAMHLTGLNGIANDVGFAIGASSYGRLRTLVINSLAAICGSRFGRGLLVPGGVRFDLDDKKTELITANLDQVRRDIQHINGFMFDSPSVLSRLEETGIVSRSDAESIGLTGPCAKASGVEADARTQFPYGAYRYNTIATFKLETGDVYARARIRALEIDESLNYIFEHLNDIPQGQIQTPVQAPAKDSGVISITEGWRGEIVHSVFTGADGDIKYYKIKDPSFNNWYGLGLAVRNEGVSDFPLCNKSFDLSYAGHDL